MDGQCHACVITLVIFWIFLLSRFELVVVSEPLCVKGANIILITKTRTRIRPATERVLNVVWSGLAQWSHDLSDLLLG